MKKTLKAGTYYIGDPCYVFNESWEDFVKAKDSEEQNFKGYDFFACYINQDRSDMDNRGNTYPFDSVTLSALPVELLNIDNVETVKSVTESEKNGETFFARIITFKNDFVCEKHDDYIMISDSLFNYKEMCDCGAFTIDACYLMCECD